MSYDEMIYPQPKPPRWKIKKSELLALPEHEYNKGPHRLEAAFQMRVSIHDIKNSKILKATLLDNTGEAQAIIFCDRNAKRDVTYILTSSRWSEACLENLPIDGNELYYKTYSITTRIYYPTDYDKNLAAEYFGYVGIPSAEAILQFQYKTRSIKLQKQHERTQQYINSIMSQLKPIPKDLDKFARNQVLREHRYIFYRRHGKNLEGTCSFCHEFVTLAAKGMKHNNKIKCPNCRSAVTLKASGKVKNSIFKDGRFVVINTINTGLMLRRFYAWSNIDHTDYREVKEELEITEDARALIPYNGTNVKHYLSEHNNGTVKWRFVDERVRTYYGGWTNNSAVPAFWFPLYQNGLTKELRGTPFEYAGIGQAARRMKCRVSVENYIFQWKAKPYLEWFVKAKLYALAEDVYNGRFSICNILSSDTDHRLYKLLGVKKSDVKVIQKYNYNRYQLDIYKLVINEPDAAAWVKLTKPEYADTFYHRLKECIEKFSVNVARRLMFKYFPTQRSTDYNKINVMLSDWLDYTGECRELGYNMRDTMVLYPNNLIHSHSITTRKLNRKKIIITDKRIRHRYKTEMKQYKYKSGDYIIMLPRNQSDLINEGKMLCHCVGSYDKKVADSSTTILFIRRRENPSNPFVTAEFSHGKVIQIRAYKNRKPDDSVLEFFDKYAQQVLSKLNEKAGKTA